MKRKIISILLVSALIVALSCSKEEAKNKNTALITFLLGDVTYMDNGQWNPAEPGLQLLETQRLKTGDRSAADVQIGESVVRVKENSELILATLYKGEISGLEKNSLELTVGKLLVKPKKLLKGEEFQVKTPTAVAGVRGTRFVVEASKTRDTRVSVLEGKVKVNRRIKALEEIESSSVKDEAVIKQFEQKVEENSVTVSRNSSAEVDAKTVDETNVKVEKIVKDLEKSEEIASTPGDTATREATVPQKTVDEKVELAKVMPVKAVPVKRAVAADMALKKEFDDIKKVEIKEVKAEKEKTSLRIQVAPDDATVSINNETIGQGNASVMLLPGTYTIQVSKKGYEPVSKKIKIGAEPVEQSITLGISRSDVRVKVNPQNARVYIDGELMGSGSISTSLSPGTYVLNVKAPGYQDVNTSIKVEQGQPLTRSLRLQVRPTEWSLKLDSPAENIVYHNDVMYLSSRDRTVRAFSRTTAKTLWKRTIPTVVSSGFVADEKNLYFGTADEYFYMINAKNGKTAWRKKLNGAVINDAAPVITPATVYVASSRGTVYAFSKTGKEKWKSEVSAGIMESPVLAGGKLFCAAQDGILYAIDADNGKPVWTEKIGERFKIAFGGDSVLAVSYYGNVKALSSKNGEVKWENEFDGTYIVNPFIYGDKVVMASLDGTIVALGKDKGEKIFVSDLDHPIRHDITIEGNSMFVSAGHSIFMLNSAGEVAWEHDTGSNIGTSALVSDKQVYVGLDNGRVISVRRKL
ncbi:MAG: PQQ-binding-like beta-propeller repeat protein [Spirochaetota bacterium]